MKRIVFLIALLTFAAASLFATTRSDYLRVIQKSRDYLANQYNQKMADWEKSYIPDALSGYQPPAFPVSLAQSDALLYHVTGKREYAKEAARILVEFSSLRKYYPKAYLAKRKEYRYGLPPMTSFFQLIPYVRSYLWIKNYSGLTVNQRKEIEKTVAKAADYVFRFHEWGPMNRCMIRAAALMAAVKALPEHPRAHLWKRLAKEMAEQSLGKWTIEDAQIYNAVWLDALLMYIDFSGEKNVWRKPVLHYYFDYLLQLQNPLGYQAEYGDNHGFWDQTSRYLAIYERGAREYKDGRYKWAANKMWHAVQSDPQTDNRKSGLSYINAYLWCDDSVKPQEPTNKSTEALEDLFGKKIVFRSGWDPDATFLLVNYRDQIGFGKVPRDYLANTIPIETEKVTHGHSDENNIGPFMTHGTVLLDVPSYFERADFYQNRIVARKNEMPDTTYRLLPFLRRHETHRVVSTQKLHFYTFRHADVSRTRVTDSDYGYVWDRVVTYLKDLNSFVVFDGIKITKPGLFTFANLWHTQKILNYGKHWYESRQLNIGDIPGRWPNPGKWSLLTYFPEPDKKREGVEFVYNWSFAKNLDFAMYRAVTDSLRAGDRLCFTTVLIPYKHGLHPEAKIKPYSYLKSDNYPNGTGVKIILPNKTILVTARLNLQMEYVRERTCPRYAYENGRIGYFWKDSKGRAHQLDTDARWAYTELSGKTINYAFVEATKLLLDKKKLFASFEDSFYTYLSDGKLIHSGAEKWESWENTVKLK